MLHSKRQIRRGRFGGLCNAECVERGINSPEQVPVQLFQKTAFVEEIANRIP
jgi:hypothetical protein